MLKAIEAFALGVALLGVTVAICNASIQIAGNLDGNRWVNIVLSILLIIISIPVTLFGSMGVLLGLTISGLWNRKRNLNGITWGINVTWLIFAYTLVSNL